jgi:signal transduction histidine kinase
LFFCCANIYASEPNEIDRLLKKADSIRTADNETFAKILSGIESEQANLSREQKYYLLYLRGFVSFKNGKIDEAISRFRDVEENANEIELRFKALAPLANLYSLKKDWMKGFKYLDKISKSYEKIQNDEVRYSVLTSPASFYSNLEQYETSRNFANRILEGSTDVRTLCVASGLKIKADLSTENINELEKQIGDAIKLCNQANEPIIVNILISYKATYHLERNEPLKVIDLLVKHMDDIKKSNYQLLINDTHSILAQAYLKIDDLENAKNHGLSVVLNKKSNAFIRPMLNAYKVLSVVAKKSGEYNAAFDYQEKYIKSKESLFEQTKAKQQAVESEKYQAAERDSQIALLNKQKKITELELETQKQMQIVWAVVFISLTLLLFFWFYRKTAQKELNRQKQVNWELKELDKLKDRILTNTSHELRTPLNGIIGLSELIVLEYEEQVEDELIKSIRLIGKSGTRLALIVSDILDLAQLKSRRIAFNFKTFDVSEIIDEVIVLCRPLIKTKNLDINYLEQDMVISVIQDKHRIQQVLFNLIGNAIKFTEKGEIVVNCEIRGDALWVHVKDTGIGIPKDKITRVFEGFEQIDNTNRRKNEGSGIGLAISRELITALGGEIKIESELGEGTIVSFFVPLAKQEDE